MAAVRVLQIVPAMDMGGLETFIMNLYRHIDRSALQFDFLYHYTRKCAYDDEILSLGGHIFKFSVREDNNLPRYLRGLDHFFIDHPEYKIVHGHYSGFGLFYNHYAKKHGVPVRIGHSHNTQTEKSAAGLADKLLSAFFSRGLTTRLACGAAAGRALYGGKDFEVYPNGIEVERFAHSAAQGAAARARLGIDAADVVYGHIGRFTQQKNHSFLLELFSELYRRQPAARLLLVGDGPLRAAAERKAASLGIEHRVVFAGLQKDTPPLYSAMDCFLLPSLFEGLPVVLIEAQANGLPCFVSAAVSREAGITPGVRFVPLENGAAAWAAVILEAPMERADNQNTLVEAGYDIEVTAKRLQALYLELARTVEGA